MTGLELLGIVSAAAFVVCIVLRDARGREEIGRASCRERVSSPV